MKYGLIGEKLSHSYSPKIHALLGNKEYGFKEIPREGLSCFMAEKDFMGINVTIPYKKDVMPHCVCDNQSAKIGSVNTVINKNGTLHGYNTDYYGFSYMAERAGITFSGKKTIILGSGGTSKTAASVAADMGASEVVIISRNSKDNYKNLEKHEDADIIVNTTPVGMYPNNSGLPVNLDIFHNLQGVIDVVYNPLKTKLVLESMDRGIKATAGLPMLVAQAAYADSLFFGKDKPDAVRIDEVIETLEKTCRNIVLIGMPGCGKTTAGKLLAKNLGLQFADTDVEIFNKTGKTAEQLITEHGEDYFRGIESQVLFELSKQNGYIIATGGGSVLKPENRKALLQNGIIVFLERELSELATNGRPLSADKDRLAALYSQRLPIYQALAHRKVKVVNDVLKTVDIIIEEL